MAVPAFLVFTAVVIGAEIHYLPGQIASLKALAGKLSNVFTSESGEAAPPASSDGKKDTLKPGEHAGDSVPARGPGRDFTPEEREKINEIGKDTGCHTCGSTDPGTKSGNFIPDHQPANALNPSGGAQELYPHCLHCSKVQGGQVRGQQVRQSGSGGE